MEDINKVLENNPWIISDTHFKHNNVISYCNRPFKSIEEMDWTIINNWNYVIGSNDLVIHLGDFALTNKGNFRELINILNGKITLFRGNHDRFSRNFYESCGINLISNEFVIWENIYFSHRPIIVPENYYNIHGHIHEKRSQFENQINISVEQMNYKPIKLNELIERRIKWVTQDG